MLRADELTVVHHDDTVSRFTDVTYTIGRAGLRVITATGDEKAFPQHDVLTTVAVTRPVVPAQFRPAGHDRDRCRCRRRAACRRDDCRMDLAHGIRAGRCDEDGRSGAGNKIETLP
jgi:hypothetical protein